MSATQATEKKSPPPPGEEKKYPQASIGTQAALAMVLLVVITIMVNYTLSPKTLSVVGALKSPVEITVFMSINSNLFGDIKEILSRYRSFSSKLRVEFVDPDIDTARFELLQKKYGIRTGTLPDGREITEHVIVVTSGDKVKFVTPDDMTEYDFGEDPYASTPSLKSFKAEEQITSAILGVTEKETTEICFTTGHGEWSAEKYDERGIGHIDEILKRDNYKTESFSLQDKPKVPQTCRLLVVAGPERPFTDKDASKVEQYLADGGNLLLFLDPIIDGTKFVPTGLEKTLSMAGIDARQAIAVESDDARLLPVSGVGMETFVSRDYSDHPITKPIEGIHSLFRIVMPLQSSSSGGASPTPLVKTSDKSWGETNLENIGSDEEPVKAEEDIPGPLTIGFASQLPRYASGETKRQDEGEEGTEEAKEKAPVEARGRVVVFGDSDMLSSELFAQLTLANQELVIDSIAWLVERPALISIPPKSPENVRLTLTDAQMRTFFYWIFINLPLLAIIAGIIVWWRRRK
jgi:hypothetical protein